MNRILNWLRLRKLENELDRELKYHIDRRVNDLIQSGLPESEARRRAKLLLPSACQGVELSFASSFRLLPIGLQPASLFQPVERRI